MLHARRDVDRTRQPRSLAARNRHGNGHTLDAVGVVSDGQRSGRLSASFARIERAALS